MRTRRQRLWLVLRGRRRLVLSVGAVALLAGAFLAGGAVYLSRYRSEARDVQAIQPSPNYRVVVEKSARRLSLYDGERLAKAWPVVVGGGRGDKLREGDLRTPEGDFFICYKNPQSKYVLSLGLSYPSEKDAQRGLREGKITPQQHDAIVSAVRGRSFDPNTWEELWKTPLGGEIMIHGSAGDRDWTHGCVAMDDDAIRELYPLLPFGTPVKIVP